MYSDLFCKVYNELGWNYYPEAFAEQLLCWMEERKFSPETSLDLACGTGVLCEILHQRGIHARGMDLSAGMIAIAHSREPIIPYDVGDMVCYHPGCCVDLVTCTGDALNHIPSLEDVKTIFDNIHSYLNPGGYLVFDILDQGEVSAGDPFEMDYDHRTRVWFQMTRPGEKAVNLEIRVYEDGVLRFEENISETIHDPAVIRAMLAQAGFRDITLSRRLARNQEDSTTWYITARK